MVDRQPTLETLMESRVAYKWPYSVPVGRHDVKSLSDWCEANCQFQWRRDPWEQTWLFQDEKDAMLFTLKWGYRDHR